MINRNKRNFTFNIPKLFLGLFSLNIFINLKRKDKNFITYENWILKKEDLE
tara:strand:- start:738 stop:890 length:153 start_codon:yes stop_codon:yes gene_type:complete